MDTTERETDAATGQEQRAEEDAGLKVARLAAELDAARERIARQEEELTLAADQAGATAKRLKETETLMSALVGRYRQAVLRAEPQLPEELVTGETAEEVDRAVTHARNVVAKVRAQVRREVDTQAPPLPPDVLARMTPEQKIRYGIGRL